MEQWDHEDRQYFKKPVEHWKQASNKNIKDWLNMAKKLTGTSEEQATKQARRRQPLVTQFFTRHNNLVPQARQGKTYS